MNDLISRQDAIDAIDEIETEVADGLGFQYEKWREYFSEMPSAQPEPIRINLNDPIKVKLTDWGKEIYYHRYDRTNQIAGREICKPKFPKEDENGYTEFQLWCFIELYGVHMGMTLPNVIEPFEIVYEMRDLPFAQPEQRWIPSGEKPPEKESYLVWMPFAPPKHRMTVAEYCGGYWNIKTPISAWMPLPKPYEEDSAE